jgi:hypothetical protein
MMALGMIPYLGDFAEDATVYIAFNTFADPAASATITNLADADIKVHKDGSTTDIVTDGATVAIDFDAVTGSHLITVDTSVHADYSTGSDYLVRIEGTTVDTRTINAFVASFSIENRATSVARTEPGQGAPGVSESMLTKIDYLYKSWRNKSTQDGSNFQLYADDGTTVDHKATVTSNGSLATKNEISTGP